MFLCNKLNYSHHCDEERRSNLLIINSLQFTNSFILHRMTTLKTASLINPIQTALAEIYIVDFNHYCDKQSKKQFEIIVI